MTNRIYAYTVIGKDAEPWHREMGHDLVTGHGLIKVGQTTRPSARVRIKQQLGTAYPNLDGVTILLDEPACRPDQTEFSDHDVHHALVAAGIKRAEGEWFEASLEEVVAAINHVRTGATFDPKRTDSFSLRPEQLKAVELTAAYFQAHAKSEGAPAPKFLWNAKMRFGKTFTAYQLALAMEWRHVLVLTYKPAVQSAWRDDLLNHLDFEGWQFIDRTTDTSVSGALAKGDDPLVWFASFQDLMGKTSEGKVKTHNELIHLIEWDCIIIDEYHFGAWRQSARDLYDPTDCDLAESEEPEDWVTEGDLGITAANYLYLSGTPFRAITNGEFTEDAVFNWTYVDEQSEKEAWVTANGPNPYLELPAMQMFSYQIGDDATEWAEDGEFNGFSLTEYFKAKRIHPQSTANGPGTFVFEDPTRVTEFLEMLRGKLSDQMKGLVLTGQKAPFPYESEIFKNATRHSVWYLADVGACYAMCDMLKTHPFFSGYEVVVAAGARAGQGAAAKPPVEAAIGKATKDNKSGTITLSCGKLMTGVTIREWGAILMLRSLRSPETYFQAAFRVQSPWAHRDVEGTVEVRKPTCYVFEFDPNRALALVAEYGVKMSSTDDTTPSDAIGQLLNFLPIFAFAGGAMTQLDSAEVLDWATAGIGATALAQRWNSPLLVDVNQQTLAKVLEHKDLLETLKQIEDFRVLADNAEHIVTSTELLKKAKHEQGRELDPHQKKEEEANAKLRKEIREKLRKFLAKIPVFMYVTDFREEALKHVIESLDTRLFERVTGLTLKDFKVLSDIGLFNADNMEAAIYQFKSFETASLHYADDGSSEEVEPIGLWDRTIDPSKAFGGQASGR